MDTLRRRLRPDDGQSTLEWIGVAAVTVVIAVALVASAPGMGGGVAEQVVCLVQRVTTGGSCAGDGPRPGEPTGTCVVSSTAGTLGGGVRIVVVDLGGGGGYVREEHSDGRVEVTFIREGSLGVSARLGGGASVDVDGVGGGGRAEGQVGAAAVGFVGDTRIFDDPADADAYIADRIADEVGGSVPVVGPVIGSVRDLVQHLTGTQPPTGEDGGSRGGVGIALDGSAEAAAGPVDVDVEAAAEVGAQVRVHPDGSMDVTIGTTGGGSLGGAAALIGLELGGGHAGSLTLGLDPEGRPVTLTVEVAVEAEGSAGITGPLADVPGIEGALSEGAGRQVTVTASVDLTDPDLGPAVDRLGDAVAAAVRGEGVAGAADAAGDLVDVAEQAATITVTTAEIDRWDAEGGASGNVGGGLGVDVSAEHVTTNLRSAHWWDPVAGDFQPWVSCTP